MIYISFINVLIKLFYWRVVVWQRDLNKPLKMMYINIKIPPYNINQEFYYYYYYYYETVFCHLIALFFTFTM